MFIGLRWNKKPGKGYSGIEFDATTALTPALSQRERGQRLRL
jgi:hypothetical protein